MDEMGIGVNYEHMSAKKCYIKHNRRMCLDSDLIRDFLKESTKECSEKIVWCGFLRNNSIKKLYEELECFNWFCHIEIYMKCYYLQFKNIHSKLANLQTYSFQFPDLEYPRLKRSRSGLISPTASARALECWKECTTKLRLRPFTNICPAFYVCMHRVECTRGKCSRNCSARCNESRAINFQRRIYYSLKCFRVKSAHGSRAKLKRSLNYVYEASESLWSSRVCCKLFIFDVLCL